ncbi:LamG-like jellyroll fold domain-containing protein [Streptomyces sp. NPDC014870]|uniref:LamG-like jellyroll fold domain-containing protein n=1 Tax=Streptomyces sp. NPDC014870 TaxID=3364925 RepID=UPI0037028E86
MTAQFKGGRWLGVLLGSALVMGMAAPVVYAEEREPALPDVNSVTQEAVQAAKETGRPVEDISQRGVAERVFAEPEGGFTAEFSAAPRWVPRGDGTWQDLDTTLEVKPDGSVGPKAALIDVEFSGGGADPLVEVRDSGRSAGLKWPNGLPEPVLVGDVAEYRAVFPGVDLQMKATAEGFQQVLVVRTEAAAADPALAGIRLEQDNDGLRIGENAEGGLLVSDGTTGEVVFSGGTPLMWDSGSETAALAAPAGVVKDALLEDPAAAPMPGDDQAEVAMEVDTRSVTLRPDPELLASADAADLPLYIDPPLAVEKPTAPGKRSFYTWANSDSPSTEYANFDDDKGVGRCTSGGCGSAYVGRMYFEFNLDGWENRKIYDATFSVYETFSYSCSPSWVNLHRVDETKLSTATNWGNKPADGDLMGDRHVAYGNEQFGCENGTVNFNDNPEETNENLTASVRSKAAAGGSIAFSLRAADEDAAGGWKRFKGDSGTLRIYYNTLPGKPSGEKTTSPTTACVTGSSRPWVNQNDTTPVLTVTAADADPHNIKVTFQAWDMVPNADDVKVYGDLVTGYEPDGAFEKGIPSGQLKHGHTYHWHAQASDGIDAGPWSDWCEFGVDTEDPDKPAVALPSAENIKAGQSMPFTLRANGNKDSVYGNDVQYYLWGLNDSTPAAKVDPAALGADGAASVAIPKFGLHTLYFQSVDRAGNASTVEKVTFQAGRSCADPSAESCTVGSYRFDETTGTVAADSSGVGTDDKAPLTVSGGSWVAGADPAAATDKAVRFDGIAADHATGPSRVDTSKSFTVSAWAKVTDATANRAVVSQSGSVGNGFSLYWSTTYGWTLARHRLDSGTEAARAYAGLAQSTPHVGKWTHLAGVFDPTRNTITLYVNGEEAGVDHVIPSTDGGTTWDPTKTWNATGGLQVGRAKWAGAFTDPFKGDIDDVRVYPTVLDRSDISRLASQS